MRDTRKDPRFPVDFGSSFSGEQVAGRGMIANLSVGGCRLESNVTLAPDTRLALNIRLPDSRWPLQIDQAVVRWARHGTVGVEFQTISRTELNRLQHLLQDLEQGPLVLMQRTKA
ncbi:PilZ domain-containing protein [Nitrospira moscoviensis]|uniref:PilZ domain-containing protein n=1 Tax=Nitrospira moscoviensis TaxID=42253 RepID=A0A0K2GD15_NITMO|nr:PilZ domain-containing protein [Nitrospira moscoviensis]ALA58851.1 hypothetical protein NITMOv2_2438 [Nitrospira moscoviensis]